MDGLVAETVAALNTAIAAAKAVNNDQESTLAQLTEAKTKLQSALDNLKTDKTALAKAIADADKEPVYIKNDSAVKTALQHAKNVYAAANPTPAEVNTAVNNNLSLNYFDIQIKMTSIFKCQYSEIYLIFF